ncbi:MAG: hypothetical protein K2P81_12725 [Bacteriovoracaceae bacterium]|nr:hypothetical protein [Bacteriovoracaceae bacterium]
MSEDQLISRLMRETFENVESDHSQPYTSHSESNFHRRRGLARLPVTTLEGRWLTDSLIRFEVFGLDIDIPLKHGPLKSIERESGKMVNGDPLIATLSSVAQKKFNSMYLCKTADGSPWIVLWNAEAKDPIRHQVLELFEEKSFKKAA